MIESDLADQVVGFLAPYAKKLAGKAADAVTGEVAEAAGRLWDKVKAKLAGRGAQKALERLEQDPNDPRKQGALALEVEEAAKEDPGFAKELKELLQTIEAKGGRDAIVQTANVQGDHSTATQIVGSGNRVG